MASHRAHAPWRKAVLIPFWTIQMFFELVMIGLLGVAAGVLVKYENEGDNEFDSQFGSVSDDAVNKVTKIEIPVWITVLAICLILTIVEIVLLARHRLQPVTFVITNSIKTGIWTVIFILDIVSAVNSSARTTSIIGILIDIILFLSFWIPLIYGSVIYHRSRTSARYKPVDHPLSMPQSNIAPTEYPSQYKNFVTEEHHDDVESAPSRPRRLSYNHQRDTRFESYRQERTSFSDAGAVERAIGSPPMGSPPIPEVYVHHHDGDAFEMESTRRDVR